MAKKKFDIEMTPYNSLFDGGGETKFVELNPEEVLEPENHPFDVEDDPAMDALVESVKKHGILEPPIVTMDDEGNWRAVAGNRRLHAAKLLGIDKVLCIDHTDREPEQSQDAMLETNLLARQMKPSELAKAVRIKLSRTAEHVDEFEGRSDERTGKELGWSRATVQRYARLAKLSDRMLALLDSKLITAGVAGKFVDLPEDAQDSVAEAIENIGRKIKPQTAAAIVSAHDETGFEVEDVEDIIRAATEDKPVQRKVILKEEDLQRYFPRGMDVDEIKGRIMQYLNAAQKQRDVVR